MAMYKNSRLWIKIDKAHARELLATAFLASTYLEQQTHLEEESYEPYANLIEMATVVTSASRDPQKDEERALPGVTFVVAFY